VLPPHDPDTGYLPPGEHQASWDEVCHRFGGNARRENLLNGLRAALDCLAAAGVARIYLDGSFITTKDLPGDYDASWEYDNYTDFSALDPVFLDFAMGRLAQKSRFGGEFFPADAVADGRGTPYRYFFQQDDREDSNKGIVVVTVREEGQQEC